MDSGKGDTFVRTKLKNVVRCRDRADVGLTASSSRPSSTSARCSTCTTTGPTTSSWTTLPYDQITVSPSRLGDASKYVKEGDSAIYEMAVGVDLPAAVELSVAETEPGVQGDRVSGARKPATLETGLVVQVPLFVNPGHALRRHPPRASTSPGPSPLRHRRPSGSRTGRCPKKARATERASWP